jgi:RNA polymerase sigma-70 factor, ECF subfamily
VETGPDFESFFADHHDHVVRALTLAVGNRSRAEDLAQEGFARAYRRWRSVSVMERPVAWVYVVALNRFRRELRRQRSEPPAGATHSDDPAASVAVVVSVRAALDTLSPRQRTAVVLRYLGDLRLAEVAEAMGCSVGTVKATLHNALRKLRVDLEEEEPDES